ncbi:tetratricopeptide repeat protein [Rickettsiales endosymbiont of Stachyamoeba lipophora]|uniref:tetratricopeptide repeat protein n=1 Tax=Rickettsiales endosymbiont of Stachyamoeba lipophora TaxID=2486578 RepID=UPI000F65540B|nr:tetratricopeptide repeat protein [Rickettsiales endosymbiont of Stachyamoeba lipophora]AZL16290.1 hypothetical protein EF513_07105 [Rickettsiales endosymbiont of Stachyamoeba lipophora]
MTHSTLRILLLSTCLSMSISTFINAEDKENDKTNNLQEKVINDLVEHYQEKDLNLDRIELKRSVRDREIKPGSKHVKLTKPSKKQQQNKDNSLTASSDILDMSVDLFHNIEHPKDLISKAFTAYTQGHYEAAFALYQKAHNQDKKNIDAQFGMAVVHQILGHMDDAKQIYLQILKKHPENKYVLNNFLNIISITDPDEALVTLSKLEEAEPNLAILPAQMAAIYHRKKDYKQAIIYYKKAARLDSQRIEYVYNMAIMFEKINQPSDAMILYNRILQAINAGYKTTVQVSDVTHRLKKLTDKEAYNGV